MRNKYCFGECISNSVAFILTKIFYRKARLIRRPLYLRGKKSLVYGKGFTTGHSCRFDLKGKEKTLIIGKNCQIGDYTHIVAHSRVTIGDNVLIASKVFVSDTNHGKYKDDEQTSPEIPPNERLLCYSPVNIGSNVWIGENVVILPGVSIGDGTIIGANSLVNKSFPGNVIIAGSPARIMKIWNQQTNKWEKYEN